MIDAKQLRAAAQNYEWRQCELQVFNLYESLSVQDGLDIAINQLTNHLQAFEQQNPSVTWVREWLGIISTLTAAKIDFPFQSDTGLYDDAGESNPGAKEYMDSVTVMQEAYNLYIEDPQDRGCLKFARGVAGSAIVSRVFAYASENCHSAWVASRSLWNDIRITEEYNLAELTKRNKNRQAFDVCTNQFHRDLWLALADEIESKLEV